MRVTISLLIKNAETTVQDLLEAVFAQQIDNGFEILVIDSGSNDKTLEIISNFPIRVIQIPSSEFGHGKTRNLAAENAHPDCEFVVYLSQDALPANDFWLENLLEPIIEDQSVAGAFSRHMAREGTSPSTVRQLTTSWQTGGTNRIAKALPEDPNAYELNKMNLIYFSNTSSAIRRSVWEEIHFKPVDFAEDAEWADRVLRAGYKLVFEPNSVVIHSHDYGFVEQLRQNVDHTNAMVQLFDPPIYRTRWMWIKLLLNIPGEVWRDWKFQYSSEFHKDCTQLRRIRWLIWSPFWHLASVLGGWLGANLQRIPKQIRILFSRQERLKRGSKNR